MAPEVAVVAAATSITSCAFPQLHHLQQQQLVAVAATLPAWCPKIIAA
jgi:hypothetical protein